MIAIGSTGQWKTFIFQIPSIPSEMDNVIMFIFLECEHEGISPRKTFCRLLGSFETIDIDDIIVSGDS
jgi:hypothetical protein